MYFVTDKPTLFNTETGAVICMQDTRVSRNNKAVYCVEVNGREIFVGTDFECQDFIFALAGWVGAVNPMEKVTR